jgi:hypothetical protein
MAKSRESFERRQRERAKKAKADAKRERRLSNDDTTVDRTDSSPSVDENAVIGKLAELHAAFDNEEISFDVFEARRSELLTHLQVD